MTPAVSVIIPAYNEGADVLSVLTRVGSAVTLHCEIVVVVDSVDDSTIPFVEQMAGDDERMQIGRAHV